MKLEQVVMTRLHALLPRQAPNLCWSPVIDLADASIESAHAFESGGQCNLAHRHARLVDQLFRCPAFVQKAIHQANEGYCAQGNACSVSAVVQLGVLDATMKTGLVSVACLLLLTIAIAQAATSTTN